MYYIIKINPIFWLSFSKYIFVRKLSELATKFWRLYGHYISDYGMLRKTGYQKNGIRGAAPQKDAEAPALPGGGNAKEIEPLPGHKKILCNRRNSCSPGKKCPLPLTREIFENGIKGWTKYHDYFPLPFTALFAGNEVNLKVDAVAGMDNMPIFINSKGSRVKSNLPLYETLNLKL